MISEINHIFNYSSCLTANEIEQYVSGTLNEKDKRRVELHLADCQMCNDEIDGYTLLKDKNTLPGIVAGLRKQVDEIISAGKIIPLQSSGKKNTKRILSIAASLILLLGAGFVINFYINNANKDLAETSATEQNLKEEAILNKSGESINVEEKKTQTNGIVQKNQNENTKTINVNLSDKNENSRSDTETDKKEDTEYVAESEKIKEYAEEVTDEDIIIDNEIIDDVTGENAVADEKKASNSGTLVSGLAKDRKVKSENEKPAENISFMTTRGAGFKRKSTIDKKEIEKFKSMRESALLSYSMKIWDEALKDFNSYLKYKPNDYEIIYKSGISYYNLKKYNKALIQFNKVIGEGINRYVENAEWYKAQSLIKLGKKSEAKIILNTIIVKNGKYQSQALDLLNSLN